MDQRLSETDVVRCQEHPDRSISCINISENCPYSSRLACVKCFMEYESGIGFMDLLEVLHDPRIIMNRNFQPKGQYDLLNEYFNYLDQEPENFIRSFKENILKQIQKLENELKQGIEKYNKFREEITKVKQQFSEALGFEKFRQAFKDILKVENYHQSEEWDIFDQHVNKFVKQFEEQQNQELIESYHKLKEMEQTFILPQKLNDFKSNIQKNVDQLLRQNVEIGALIRFTNLCDRFYLFELIQRISKKWNGQPKIKLIFKASQDGLNAKAFWAKCSNQGPTIIFCKSKTGYIFGGYTPCIWQPIYNGIYYIDYSKTSFLFSYTQNEIYPIQSGYAIYSIQDQGPQFGRSELVIGSNFQMGSSNMEGTDYSIGEHKISNQKTHLMGGEQPDLVEMEVFLIE